MTTDELTHGQILNILISIKNHGKTRADIMMEWFELSDIDAELLPSDVDVNGACLKNILVAGAAKGWC